MNTKIGMLLGLAILVTGCGNAINPGVTRLGSSPSTLGEGAGNSLAACTSSMNIRPMSSADWGTFNSGTFSSCTARSTNTTVSGATDVQLYSQHTGGSQWCFIPTIATQYGRTYINIPGSVNPMILCAAVSNQSAKITVPMTVGTQFNSGYVIDSRDQSQMSSCLVQRNPSLCPKYVSFGVL